MTTLKIKHVVSFSSEDVSFPAENLTKIGNYYKWKCSSGAERQASVILHLEKTSKIQSIDIGNCGSAFIEVLVGRSSWSPDQQFKVLLAASSFMSPVESKSCKELTRVRMFGANTLVKSVAEEMWDRIKVVCTQPYNQTDGYGLSFIRLTAPLEKNDKEIQLGGFKLREESDETINTGSFFLKKLSAPKPTPKLSLPSPNLSTPKPSLKRSVSKPKTCASPKLSMAATVRQASHTIQIASSNKSPNTLNAPKAKRKIESLKKESTLPPKKKIKANEQRPKRKKSPQEIMQGVTFVLSGFENPLRSEVRELGVSLGAKYSDSWNHNSTHLICAFPNTPKFKQVKGKGKIVKKEWFAESKKRNTRVKSKSFRIDGGGDSSASEESESGEDEANNEMSDHDTDDELERIRKLQTDKDDIDDDSTKTTNDKTTETKGNVTTETTDDVTKIATDNTKDDSMDNKREDIYDGTTEEESGGEDDSGGELADFFDGMNFFIYGDMDDKRIVKRYITAYAGCVKEYMSETIDYVITCENWSQEFEQAQSENENLKFVRPAWITRCHEKQSLLRCKPYLLSS